MEESNSEISQLPNELLSMILEDLQDDVEINKRGGGLDIKNCRLVCRRFCDLSSRLLIRSVQVGHSFASLARLDAISRHPSISLGVRTIEVVLSSYPTFEPSLEGKRGFLDLQLKKLPKSVQLFEVGRMRNLSESDTAVLNKAHEVLSCWRYIVQEPRMQSSPKGDLALHRILIEKAFQDFQKLAQEQQSLVSRGAMGEAVASALLRMPSVRRLKFYDTHPYGFLRRGLSRATSDTVFDGIYHNTLLPFTRRDLEQRTSRSFSDTVGQFRLLEALPRVLAAVGSAGQVGLKSLEVDVDIIALNEIINDTQNFQQNVMIATRELTDLSIRQKRNGSHLPSTEMFLGLCCASPELRKCSISLETGTYSMSSLLSGPGAREQRKNLTVIQVYGAEIRAPDLKQLLNIIPDVLDRVELVNVRLLDGSWREILDLLREKTYRKSEDWIYPVRIFEAVSPDPDHPLSRIFEDIFDSDETWCISDADSYVLRYSEVNPFAPEAGRFPLGHTFHF